MGKLPPQAFVDIQETIVRMADSERCYLRAWLRRWVNEKSGLKRSAFLYPKPIDWKEIEGKSASGDPSSSIEAA